MAYSSKSFVLPLFFFFSVLLCVAQVSLAGRQVQGAPDERKTPMSEEGTVLVPGIGRFKIGAQPTLPTVGRTYTGDSIPAAINGKYIPGLDDTYFPNPGYEVPNPYRGGSSP